MTQQQKNQMIRALRKAIAYYDEPKVAFANALSIHESMIYHWLSGRATISLRLACKIEDLVGKHVSIYELVPTLLEKLNKRKLD